MSKKIDDLVGNKTSPWLKEAQWRQANRDWLSRSFEIALQVLTNLRKQSKNQKWLAEQLNVPTHRVSKMVKGKENFTLQTIAQLEKVLGIQLIDLKKHAQ
jgi:ribosome-binding protein aMBF1 (putative translation factor)